MPPARDALTPALQQSLSPFDAEGPVAASPFDAGGDGWVGHERPEEARAAQQVAPPPPRLQPPPVEDVHTERARYFVITSNTKENVVKSVKHGLWATQRKNEQRLDEAFRSSPAVILVFSVNRSEAFQGYARMRSPVGRPQSRSADPFNGFGRLFDVEWLRLHDLPYKEVATLRNSMNDDRPVQTSRDGQELSNSAGRRLCWLIDKHIDDPASFAPPQVPAPRVLVGGGLPLGLTAMGHFPYEAAAMCLGGAAGRPRSRSSDSSGRARKRRKREKLYRKAPHCLESTLEEQVEYFLGLDYEDYVEWFKRYGAVSPGPALPLPGPAPGFLLPP